MRSAIEYAAIPTINLTPLFIVTNPPHQFFTVRKSLAIIFVNNQPN